MHVWCGFIASFLTHEHTHRQAGSVPHSLVTKAPRGTHATMLDDASDSGTVRGFGYADDSRTETESIASSARAADRNRKKKDKKKASAAAKKLLQQQEQQLNGEAGGPSGSSSSSSSNYNDSAGSSGGFVVEYVSSRSELDESDPAYAEFASVFGKFSTAEQLTMEPARSTDTGAAEDGDGTGRAAADDAGGGAASRLAIAQASADDEADAQAISNRAKKKLKRLSISELKQLVAKPDAVEAWDVTADDPRLLVHLKATRNTIPVPKHWSQKRKFLMGKRGTEKPAFQLPEFIAATGIEKIRNAVMEKENAKRLKGKMKEKMQPKMGKIDIDYQVLHDAFFKYQSKPRMTRHGDVYYEGKEHEAALRVKRPGQLSAELVAALDITNGGPPPWLVNMQRYGPPPSYPSLKIPGLNAPIPEGASYGFHAGGWGKPPVDEFGRPLYGDVFGTAEPSALAEPLEPGLHHEPWGAFEDYDEEEEGEEDDGEGSEHQYEGSTLSDDDVAAGISSVASTTPSGMATPDALNLRKAVADGLGTPSEGRDTPESSLHGSQPPQLFHVLEQTSAKVGGAAFGSSHGYVVPPVAGADATTSRGVGGSGRAARPAGAPDVELALDPSELERLDEASLKARYEKLQKAQRNANAPEDVSDIIAEQERKRKRKLDAAANRGNNR